MQATVQSMQAIPVTQKKRIQQKVDQIDDLFAQHLASIADMACLGLQFTPRQKMQSSKVYLYQWKAYLDSLPADIKTLEFGEGHQKIKVDLGTVCGPGINPPAGWRSREFLRASLDRMYWEGSKDNALKSLHVLHSFWVSKATEPFVHAASRLTLAGVLGLRTSYGVSTTVLRAQRARRIHNRYRMAKVASDIAGVTVGSIAFAEIHYHSLRLAVGQTHKRELGKEYLMGAAIFWVMPRVQNLFLRGGQYLRGWARLGKNSKIDVSRVKMDMRRFGRMDTYHKFESWQEASYFMSARVLADTFTFGSLPYIERAGGKAWGYTSVQLGNLMLAENEKVPYEYGDPVFQGDIGDNLWSGFETGAGFYVFGKLAGRWGMHKQKRSMLREYKRRTLATNHLRRQLANDFPAFAALSTREKAQKITEKDLSALWQAHRQKVYDDSGLITPDGTARKKVEQDLAEVLEVPLDLVYRAGVPLAEMKIRRLYETINPAEVYTPPGPDATLGSKHPGMDLRKIVNEAHEIIKQVQHSKTQNPSEEGMQDHVHHAAEDIRFIYDKIIELRIQGYMHLKRGGVDRKTKELYKALRRIKDEAETFHYGNHKHDSKNSTDTQELTL
jgi:hypothetical protein